MREWIKEAQTLNEIARNDDLVAKRVIAKKMFGSNLRLGGRSLEFQPIDKGEIISKNKGETQWTALVAAHEIVSRSSQNSVQIDLCMILQRVAGIEPACRVWKTPIITTI